MVPPFFNLCTVCTAAKVGEDQPPHRKLHTIFLQLELDTPRKRHRQKGTVYIYMDSKLLASLYVHSFPSWLVWTRFQLCCAYCSAQTAHKIEPCCCKKQQKKSPNQETGLGSRGRLNVLNDTKLVLNEHE
jgi:hypothetical protein